MKVMRCRCAFPLAHRSTSWPKATKVTPPKKLLLPDEDEVATTEGTKRRSRRRQDKTAAAAKRAKLRGQMEQLARKEETSRGEEQEGKKTESRKCKLGNLKSIAR